jgi:hypothetical protein
VWLKRESTCSLPTVKPSIQIPVMLPPPKNDKEEILWGLHMVVYTYSQFQLLWKHRQEDCNLSPGQKLRPYLKNS